MGSPNHGPGSLAAEVVKSPVKMTGLLRNDEPIVAFKNSAHLLPTGQHPVGDSLLVSLRIEDQSPMGRHHGFADIVF